jgi:hypothetical protein
MVSSVEFAATAVGQQRVASCSPAAMARQILAAAAAFCFGQRRLWRGRWYRLWCSRLRLTRNGWLTAYWRQRLSASSWQRLRALICQASLAILRKRFVQSWPSDRRTFSLPPPNAKAEIGLPEHDTMRCAGIISAMPAN